MILCIFFHKFVQKYVAIFSKCSYSCQIFTITSYKFFTWFLLVKSNILAGHFPNFIPIWTNYFLLLRWGVTSILRTLMSSLSEVVSMPLSAIIIFGLILGLWGRFRGELICSSVSLSQDTAANDAETNLVFSEIPWPSINTTDRFSLVFLIVPAQTSLLMFPSNNEILHWADKAVYFLDDTLW